MRFTAIPIGVLALALAACRPTAAPVAPTAAPVITAVPESAEPVASPPAEAPPATPAPAPLANGMPPLPTGPIAIVNGVEIPSAAFHAIYDLKVAKYAARGREVPASADRRYRKSIAERLIYHEVLQQAAAAVGVVPDMARLVEREAQQKRGIKDWPKHLMRRGETEHSLREMYLAEELERALLFHRGKLTVTDADVEAEYQSVKANWVSDEIRLRASHIVVPFDAPADADAAGAFEAQLSPEVVPPEPTAPTSKAIAAAKRRATEIHKRAIRADADFAALAKAESIGPSRSNGGDIGIFPADRMDPAFSKAALALQVGGISKPVRTKFGFHIIKVTGRWPPGELPKSALEDSIESRLATRNLHRGRLALKAELLAKAKIVDHVAPTLGPDPRQERVVDPDEIASAG